MTKKPLKKDYDLQKVKILPEGGIEVNFTVQSVIGSATYQEVEAKKSTKEPHPDLTNILRRMARMVAQVYGYTSIKEVVMKDQFEATVSQKEYIKELIEGLIDRITVTGVSISGKEGKKGAVITAKLKAGNKQVMSINTHRILFTSSTYGFEEELGEDIETLADECYLFIFEDKVQNPEMVFEEETEEVE